MKYPLTNLIPEPRDSRDFLLKTPLRLTKNLPRRVDLRQYSGAIEDQQTTGSCVANSTVSALEILLQKANKFEDLSRLFIYWNIRESYANLRGVDGGAYLSDAFKSISKQGVVVEPEWPFIVSNVNVKPPANVYQSALSKLDIRYERVGNFTPATSRQSQELIKATLAMGYPVTIGMAVHSDIFYLTGDLSSPSCKYNKIVSSTAEYAGGHAMCLVGYDEDLGGFIVENSWGSGWGDHGFGILGYDALEQQLFDAWTVTRFNGVEFAPEWQFSDPDPLIVTMKDHKKIACLENPEDVFIHTDELTLDLFGGSAPFKFKWVTSSTQSNFVSPGQTTIGSMLCNNWKNNEVQEHRVLCIVTDSSIPTSQSKQVETSIKFVKGSMNSLDLDSNYSKAYRLYQAAFARKPDQGGLDFWTNALNNGTTLFEVALGFIWSAEFNALYGSAVSPTDFITRIYANVLHRAPDEGGLKFWVDQLNSANGSKEKQAEIMIGFSESAENHQIQIW